jgi:hypothetical protein
MIEAFMTMPCLCAFLRSGDKAGGSLATCIDARGIGTRA